MLHYPVQCSPNLYPISPKNTTKFPHLWHHTSNIPTHNPSKNLTQVIHPKIFALKKEKETPNQPNLELPPMRGLEVDLWQAAIALGDRHAGRVHLLPHAGHGHHPPRAPASIQERPTKNTDTTTRDQSFGRTEDRLEVQRLVPEPSRWIGGNGDGEGGGEGECARSRHFCLVEEEGRSWAETSDVFCLV